MVSPASEYSNYPIDARLLGEHSLHPTLQVSVISRDTAYFSAELRDMSVSPRSMVFLGLRVDNAYRRKGIATRLVSSLAYIAIANDVAKFRGSIESQHVVKIFGRVFGEAVSYYGAGPPDFIPIGTPLTQEQAHTRLAQAEQFEPDPEWRNYGITAEVDLTRVDPNSLERPANMPHVPSANDFRNI